MLNIEIYIYNEADEEWQRLDLYEDETIQFVDSIQDIREPDAIFAGYTKQFAVPASKTNNKAFRHFYNADISNGFDARVRADARININGFRYKSGQLKLNSAKLKDGKASSYSLVFYGDASRLKEELGQTKLSSLTSLGAYDHDYTVSNVRSGFQTGLKLSGGSVVASTGVTDAEVVYPFITHTTAYGYNDASTPKFYQIDNTSVSLDYQELKPGIRFTKIIDAINTDILADFGSSIDTSGFIAQNDFKYMYLWCHKEKGGMQSVSQNESFFYWADRSYTAGAPATEDVSFPAIYNYFNIGLGAPGDSWDFDFDFTITGTGDYDVYVINTADGSTFWTEKGLSGNQTVSFTLYYGAVNPRFQPYVRVVSDGGITQIDLKLTATINASSQVGVYDYTAINPVDYVNIPFNMPDMTVIDWLRSVFKMFNLVMWRDVDGVYYIDTMNTFFASGTTRDITEYVDPTETEVFPSRPYDKLSFRFEEPKSFLINERYQELGEYYGDDTYDVGDAFESNEYEIKVGFEKVLFERMTDNNDDSLTNILWAWCVDDKLDPYVGKPICFYYGGGLSIATKQVIWEADSGTSSVMARCSNGATAGIDATVGFKSEINEYSLVSDPDSLFTQFWEDYIAGVYDISSRLIRIKAVLPPGFILTYSLADTIIYKNKEYFINEIDVNISTGESDIELITKWL